MEKTKGRSISHETITIILIILFFVSFFLFAINARTNFDYLTLRLALPGTWWIVFLIVWIRTERARTVIWPVTIPLLIGTVLLIPE